MYDDFAPNSAIMLASAMRESMVIASTPLPLNSTDAYSPPSAPQSPMIRSAKSLVVTPGGSSPSQDDADRFGHAQPQFASRPKSGNLTSSDPCAERAQPAEVGGMAVRAKNHLAWQH